MVLHFEFVVIKHVTPSEGERESEDLLPRPAFISLSRKANATIPLVQWIIYKIQEIEPHLAAMP
jgi:hypothetical protein